mgnify:CR=1 FL=1
MEDYATTPAGDNQREDLPSPSIMERDQAGSSLKECRDASANGVSTSYFPTQDQGLGMFGEISISSLFHGPIVQAYDPARHTLLQEAELRDQARVSHLNVDAPVWGLARTSTRQTLNETSSSNSSRGKAPVVTLRTPQSQAHDPVPVPLHLQSGEDLIRHFDELQTHPDWQRKIAEWMSQIPGRFLRRYVTRVAQLNGDNKVVECRRIIVHLAQQHDVFLRRRDKRQMKVTRRLELQIKECSPSFDQGRQRRISATLRGALHDDECGVHRGPEDARRE